MNDFVAVEYQLFVKDKDDEEERLQEQRTEEQPLVFITDLNMVLPAFEKNISLFNKGDKMDFYIEPAQAYGEYNNDLIIKMPVEKFLDQQGKLNQQLFFVGNVIGLQNPQGEQFNAIIRDIDKDNVTVDLNHPRAGMSMHFIGKVIERRKATSQEVEMAQQASKCGCGGCSGGGCGSQCGGCDSGCGGCG